MMTLTQDEDLREHELRQRCPGRDVDELADEDLLREVMNMVGKPGKLGEGVRRVVSVSMLTEGWDANTVTHVLGVRAFGTQLLCEQVVGRGLRRRSYVVGDNGRFEPEYAEVSGVPFIQHRGAGRRHLLGDPARRDQLSAGRPRLRLG
jgi:type III restriction enzyme